MRIGLFTDTYFPQINGVGASVHTLAQQLRARGHEVFVITASDPHRTADPNDPVISMASVPFIFLKQFRAGMVFSPHQLYAIQHLQLDIVHTQTEFSLGFFGRFYAKVYRIPTVHTYHTMYADYTHYIGGGKLVTPAMAIEFSKLFCNGADEVVVPTQKVKDTLMEYGVTRPIHIIPTGIPLAHFRKETYRPEEIAALRAEVGLSPETPVILSLGRVAKEKSIDVVIAALPKLLQKLPQAKLVIVGDGPYAEVLKQQAAALGVAESVLFLGARPWAEIGKYYQLGDVFVSASTSETQGLTFAEAMAAGTPVLAKKDESIHGLLEDEVNGIVFDTDASLPDRLYELLSDPAKRERLAQAARESVEALSDENFGKNIEALYKEVLSAQPAAHSLPAPIRHVATIPNAIGEQVVKARVLLRNAAERPKRLVQNQLKKLQ